MTASRRGDVVLVGFVFSDEAGKKLRPAVVLSSSAYNQGRQEVIVAAITSNVSRRLFGNHVLTDWKGAGLLFPSVVTGVLRTIKRTMIDRRLGKLALSDLEACRRVLRRSLGFE
jgi:mRNA interferase MazF